MRSLVLGAIGIVFGDIGTSPLYTFQECLSGPHGVSASRENVLGVLSLIVWAVTLVVTIKYLAFVMRAHNRGEGGIFALLALAPVAPALDARGRAHLPLVTLAVLVGAALLFGDGIITPAISVLSAIEGLEVAAPSLSPYVVPITVVILAVLFAVQSRGTGKIGALFGPVMVLWFTTIGVLGAIQIARDPDVLWAISPIHAVRFFRLHGWQGFTMLGSVVLAVTGGEALYADMGHFGARPIRLAWLALVFPSLILCYLGQGALIMRDPSHVSAPFFGMVPVGAFTYALVAIAAPATVIASQALISGVFSLTHQAVRLGYFPRVQIRHTSDATEGQIYVPAINWALALACIAIVLGFQHSARLAAAFGLAVSGTMALTSVVYFVVVRQTWKWPLWRALLVLCFFLSFDIPFVAANLLKFWDGGYLPLLVGALFFVVMVIWRIGRTYLAAHFADSTQSFDGFLSAVRACEASADRTSAEMRLVARTPGTGVFLASVSDGVPVVVQRHVKRLRVLPERVVIFTVKTEHVPVVDASQRIEVDALGNGFHRVIAHAGFMETPNVPALLREAIEKHGLSVSLDDVTYYLGRETFVGGAGGRMGAWSESLFAFLSRNAYSAPIYYGVPPERVVELGAQIDL
jgi:KUP system potassium uptake protein